MAKKTFKQAIDPLDDLVGVAAPADPEQNRKPEEHTAEPAQAEPKKKEALPTGYKYNPLYVETRSQRLQLLVTPSVAEGLKAKAKAEGRSLNDLANEIFREALNG